MRLFICPWLLLVRCAPLCAPQAPLVRLHYKRLVLTPPCLRPESNIFSSSKKTYIETAKGEKRLPPNKYASAAHHFERAISLSMNAKVSFPLVQIDLNSTFNSIVVDCHYKLADIYRLCHSSSKNCPESMLSQKATPRAALEKARDTLLLVSAYADYTFREADRTSQLLQLYEVYIQLDDLSSAASTFLKALSRTPTKEGKSALLLASCRQELRRRLYGEARYSCRRSLELAPSHDAYFLAAEVEKKVGNFSFAAFFYEKALSSGVVNDSEMPASQRAALVSSELGAVLSAMGKHSAAEPYFKMAVGADIQSGGPISALPSRTPSYVKLSKLFLMTNRDSAARGMFEKALKLNSELSEPQPEACWNFCIGLSYGASSSHNDAYKFFTKAVKKADESKEKNNGEGELPSNSPLEYKHLAAAVHTLPTCPVLDHRLTDRSLFLAALRRSNATEGVVPETFLLPEELERFKSEKVEMHEQLEKRPPKTKGEKRWLVKPRKGFGGGGIFIGGIERVEKVVEENVSVMKHHYVASEYLNGGGFQFVGGTKQHPVVVVSANFAAALFLVSAPSKVKPYCLLTG